MAAPVKGKGNVVQMEISSVYTPIPQVYALDKTGEKSETFAARTFDGPAHDLQPSTGFVSNPTWKLDMFLDTANVVHLRLKTDMRAPPAAGVNFRHIDVSVTPVTETWNMTGIQVDEKYVTDDGVKATVTLTTNGNPS